MADAFYCLRSEVRLKLILARLGSSQRGGVVVARGQLTGQGLTRWLTLPLSF